MSVRLAEAQTKHDNKVKEIADSYHSTGYEVYADHVQGRYGKPLERNGHIPDVVAKKVDGNKKLTEEIIVEVETKDSVDSEEAVAQRNAFEAYARGNPSIIKFILLVV